MYRYEGLVIPPSGVTRRERVVAANIAVARALLRGRIRHDHAELGPVRNVGRVDPDRIVVKSVAQHEFADDIGYVVGTSMRTGRWLRVEVDIETYREVVDALYSGGKPTVPVAPERTEEA